MEAQQEKDAPVAGMEVEKDGKVPILGDSVREEEVTGVLVMHIIEITKLYNTQKMGNLQLYCRVKVKKFTKRTKLAHGRNGTGRWDDTLHFPVNIVSTVNHPQNYAVVEVLGFHPKDFREPDNHVLIGSLAFQMHDILKETPIRDEFAIYKDHTLQGVLLMEMCFFYGSFGYGWSHQFRCAEEKTAESKLDFSLFPRIDPQEDEADRECNVLIPRAVPHPDYIPHIPEVAISHGVLLKSKKLFADNDTFNAKSNVLELTNECKKVMEEHANAKTRREKIDVLAKYLENNSMSQMLLHEPRAHDPRKHGQCAHMDWVDKVADRECNSESLKSLKSLKGDSAEFTSFTP